MELRIYRTWSYITDANGRLGGPIQYKLIHHDTLQFRPVTGHGEWVNVPVVEAEKPKHPDDIKREQDLKEISDIIDKGIKDGTIKFTQNND